MKKNFKAFWQDQRETILWLLGATLLSVGLILFSVGRNKLNIIQGELGNSNIQSNIINRNLYYLENMYANNYLKSFTDQTIQPEDITSEQLNRYKEAKQANETLGAEIQSKVNALDAQKLTGEALEQAQETLNDEITKLTANYNDQNLKLEMIDKINQFIETNKKAWLKQIELSSYIENKSFDYYMTLPNNQIVTNNSQLKKIDYNKTKAWLESQKNYDTVVATTETFSLNDLFYFDGQNTNSEAEAIAINAWNEQTTINQKILIGLKVNSPFFKSIQKNEKLAPKYQFIKYSGLFIALLGLIIIVYQYFKSTSQFNWLQKRSVEIRVLMLLIVPFLILITLKSDLTSRTIFLLLCLLTASIYLFNAVLKNLITLLAKSDSKLSSLHQEIVNHSWTKQILNQILNKVGYFSILSRLVIYAASYTILTIILIAGLIIINSIFQIGILILISVLIVIGYFIGSIIVAFRLIRQTNRLLLKPAELLNEHGNSVPLKKDVYSANQYLNELGNLIDTTKATSQKSEAFKNDLITNVSHDLRTPLTSIITYGDLLTQDGLTEANRQEYLGVINQKSARMKEMIEDLFEVIKMDHGDIVLNKSEINLAELLEQIIAENSELFEKNQLSFITKLPNQPVFIAIDGNQIWRVIENLLINAGKYSLEGSRIHIRLDDAPNQVHLTIKNTSKFLLDEDAEKLIERFGRGDRSRHSDGNGLGLAIVDSIIKLHGGSFQVIIDGDMFKAVVQLPKGI
ncbi:MAG: HAMP domain-containing histidine kinase [Streptococcaceae bacterium]|jgi:signal transduction histidine kinase|nr:HAMP domain-containing histidine kinase [Streptococcaceae bacterium]MCH4176391.1 HAMP domain-containing histidine kinase [Streptococcaceae bacterium]